MIHFLKNQRPAQAGLIVQERKPDNSDKPQENQDLEACAIDLLKAIKANDIKGIADALAAAYAICDMAPHEEGPHTYDSNKE